MNMNDMPITTDVAAQEQMDDTELEAIIGQDLTDAVSYIDSDISPIRAMGTAYYRGDPFGNEEDGRSQVVAMEVRDTVSAMMPSLSDSRVSLRVNTSVSIENRDGRA
mgnify:CR=1 FL=1